MHALQKPVGRYLSADAPSFGLEINGVSNGGKLNAYADIIYNSGESIQNGAAST